MPARSTEGARRDPGRLAGTISPYEENSSTLAVIFHAVGVWLDRRRRRQALQDLAERNNYLLADVGLTQEEALREAAKPFWRA